ncbi:MAG TPA: hypothetical protein V6D26_08310 [Stenomitos sp.]
MSEAETPNNQPLPEPTASMEDSAADVPEGSGASPQSQIIKLSDLRNFIDVVQASEPDSLDESEVESLASSTAEVDEHLAETPDTEASLRRSHDADWFALAQKMRQRNHKLHEQVAQLRQALKEKQEALHQELMRSRDREMLIVQQAEDMNTIQEQLARLFHALESSHQAAVRQQLLIETLSEQLQSSQERIAQLERECALTQQRYNDQSHQLMQAGNTCRELRSRLHRQQQQTLQFKTALEKSLDMTQANQLSGQQPPQRGTLISLIHKAQPIQPWSAAQELVQDPSEFEPLWSRPIAIEPPSVEPFVAVKPWDESSENAGVTSELPTLSLLKRLEETNPPPTVDVSEPTQIQSEAFPEPETDSSEQEWEEQLLAEMSSLAEASGLAEVQSDGGEVQSPFIPELETNLEESEESELSPLEAQDFWSFEDSEELDTETPTQDEDDWERYDTDELEPSKDVVLPPSNWPSPTLYPLRTPKKRKSLAAIDLPSFPRFEPS